MANMAADLRACAARRLPAAWPWPTDRAACLAACHFAFDGVGRADDKGLQLRSVSEQFLFLNYFLYTHQRWALSQHSRML
jgi:hypothetical protein